MRETAKSRGKRAQPAETERFRNLRAQLMGMLELRSDAGDDEIREMIHTLVLRGTRAAGISVAEQVELSEKLFSSVRGLDILQELIDDPGVTEIMVNGPDCIFIERGGQISRLPGRFESAEKLLDLIVRIVGQNNRVLNEQNPIADARLPDGSRVNAVAAPAAIGGPILTIRKFPERPIGMEELILRNSITAEAACDLERYVKAGYSVIIGGGTSAGKTTFLNALSNYVPRGERLITIEDNAELQIQGCENLVRLEAKSANMEGNREITIRDLIRSALRMRPDRIIVGEVRSGEAADLLQALNTGHDGSMSTIHANSAEDVLIRLETLCMMALPIPLHAVRRQILSGVDLVVHLGRLRDRSRRVLEIAELEGMKDGEILTNCLYRFSDERRELVRTGELKHTLKLMRNGG